MVCEECAVSGSELGVGRGVCVSPVSTDCRVSVSLI